MVTLQVAWNWIMANQRLVYEVLVVVAGLILMGKQHVLNLVASTALEAEKYLGDLDEAKKQFVVETVYSHLPAAIKPFISKAFIALLVEDVVAWAHTDAEKRLQDISQLKDRFTQDSSESPHV